ncbi:MAG: hypothetical protein ACYTCU_06660 [Planctomycetota bacterium]
MALAPWTDGSRLAVASWGDTTLNLRDTRSGETVAVLAGHSASITALAVAADAGRLVSASADGTLRSWETRLDLARDLWTERARR